MKIRTCVAGATGFVGRSLVHAIHQSSDFELVGAVSRTYHGQNLGRVLNIPEIKLIISGSVEEALSATTNVLIDYTHPEVVKRHVLYAITKGVHVVIGTSGLRETAFAEIDAAARAKGVGVLVGGNFAITAMLLQQFALMAAKTIPHWEIIDYADATKIDSPSGTATELASRLAQVRKPIYHYPIEKTLGNKESRGATVNGSQLHSIRLPGNGFATEIIFGMPGEKLIIRHEAQNSAEPYVSGTLDAARKVVSSVGLVQGL
jgi:4-hydroxy-tetrahydrodipicolinate reductase